jgi:quinol monooxygenase YgiN
MSFDASEMGSLVAVLSKYIVLTRMEQGCRNVDMIVSDTRPNRILLIEKWDSPALLGYVKTLRKASAQIPLVTDLGDPLLAHWRFGLGKVTAFTSDAKSRWGSLWITRWPGFSRFWSQVLRETARPPQRRHPPAPTAAATFCNAFETFLSDLTSSGRRRG